MIQQSQKHYRKMVSEFLETRMNTLGSYLGKIVYDEYFSSFLAEKLPENRQKSLLKDLYNNCHDLGKELRNLKEEKWSSEEILELLLHTNIPSITGEWKINKINRSHYLSKEQSTYEPYLLRFRYWEKAIDGFVSGLNNSVHYVINSNSDKKNNLVTHTIYDANFYGHQLKEVPEKVSNLLNSLNKNLEKYDINLILDGYLYGIIFYHLKGYSVSSMELLKEQIITDTIINLARFRTKDLRFVEVIKQ